MIGRGTTEPAPATRTAFTRVALALLAVSCRCEVPGPAVVPIPVTASCAELQGKVEVLRGGTGTYWEPAGVGSLLRAGDWVRTGEHAYVRIEFPRGGTLELEERTTVLVDSDVVESAAPARLLIALESGRVSGDVSHEGGLALRTASGEVVSLSPSRPGAELKFQVERRGAGVSVSVLEGEGRLGDRVVAAGAGMAYGTAEALPFDVIAFPESESPRVDARFVWRGGLSVPLSWKEVEGATGYLVQIANDLSFRRLETSAEIAERTYAFVPPRPGMYAWRVAARGPSGVLGEYGFARRLFFTEAPPPTDQLVSPERDAVVFFESVPPAVTFSWNPVSEDVRYRWVLARNATLEKPVLERTTKARQLDVPQVAAGEYYWGVFEVEGGVPLFTSPRRLSVRRAAPLTVKTPSSISNWGETGSP